MLAAEQNDTEALNTLGYCYYSGTGVVRNYEKAVKYFRQSAELGNDKGELNLANCYYGGKGVKKDLEKAKHLFESAAKKGNREAKDILKIMKF
jgi:TPR repeat protein